MKDRYDLKFTSVFYKIRQRIWVYTPKTQKGFYGIVQRPSPVTFKFQNSGDRLFYGAAQYCVNIIVTSKFPRQTKHYAREGKET